VLDLGKDSVVVGVRKPRLPVLVAGLVLVLAGCSGDDPEPKMAPTESVASTPSTSAPTVSPSVDPLSPEETVRAWVKAQNEALSSGDTSAARDLSATPCEACDGMLDPIDRVYAAGGHFETRGWKIDRLKLARTEKRRSVVNTAITIAGGRTVNAAGEPPVIYEVERSIVRFKLIRVDDQWFVSFIGFP
jgi:hypothetical protein